MIVTGTCELKDEFCPHKEDIPEVSEPDVCKRGPQRATHLVGIESEIPFLKLILV